MTPLPTKRRRAIRRKPTGEQEAFLRLGVILVRRTDELKLPENHEVMADDSRETSAKAIKVGESRSE